jgi:hypothetical protein
MQKPTMIAALLALGVSGCNRPPAPQSASHPVALDLVCLAEPPALTDAEVAADDVSETQGLGRPLEQQFNDDVLLVGRDCRDTLRRACQWHKDRGFKEVDCDKPRQP